MMNSNAGEKKKERMEEKLSQQLPPWLPPRGAAGPCPRWPLCQAFFLLDGHCCAAVANGQNRPWVLFGLEALCFPSLSSQHHCGGYMETLGARSAPHFRGPRKAGDLPKLKHRKPLLSGNLSSFPCAPMSSTQSEGVPRPRPG